MATLTLLLNIAEQLHCLAEEFVNKLFINKLLYNIFAIVHLFYEILPGYVVVTILYKQ